MSRRMRGFVIAACALGGLACGASGGPGFIDQPTGPMITSVSGEAGSTGGSAGSSSSTGPQAERSTSTSADGSSEAGPGLDMAMPDFGEVGPQGCQGKIDFMFVISPHFGMEIVQKQLLASFPGFIASIEANFPGFDVHIMSADGDGYWGIQDCSVCMKDCDKDGEPTYCGADLDMCDLTYGAGVTFPSGGKYASNRRCKFAGGNRYITREEPDITAAFTCAAQVGAEGGEGVAQGMVEALKPAMNAEGGCNAGFLRDDALLVVVLIQGAMDIFSDGTPETWIEALRAAKGGDDDAYTVLVLTSDYEDFNHLCPGEYDPSKNPLRVLANGVEHGFVDSICKDDFVPFFDAAVGEIVQLCDDLVPK